MVRDNWVKSLGLDRDGSLFVDIDTGTRLYDRCLDHPLAEIVILHPEDLMRGENRPLYNCFLTTLNEIAGIVFGSNYDGGHEFKDGEVVVDAGARIGTFSAKVSAAVGKNGRVIAVEPEPRNFSLLCKNIEANRLDNVIPVRKMLWSEAGEVELFLSANASSHSAYFDGFYSSTGETITAAADTLDRILDELGIGAVDFVKMDIEGAEIEAFRGMTRTLKSGVELAISAYHPVNGNLTHTVVVPQLERLGFGTSYRDGIIFARAAMVDLHRPFS